MVVLRAPVPRTLIHCATADAVKEQRAAWVQLGAAGEVSGADRVPVMVLRDVSQQQPHGMPTLLHLSHSKGMEEQGISVRLKVK